MKTDPKTKRKYITIGRKKYWVKASVTKKQLGRFINSKLKDFGFQTGKIRFKAKAKPASFRGPPVVSSKKPFPTPPKITEQEIEQLQRRREPENIELFQLTKEVLMEMARKAEIKGRSTMTKAQLITALRSLSDVVDVSKAEEAKKALTEKKALEAKKVEGKLERKEPETRPEFIKSIFEKVKLLRTMAPESRLNFLPSDSKIRYMRKSDLEDLYIRLANLEGDILDENRKDKRRVEVESKLSQPVVREERKEAPSRILASEEKKQRAEEHLQRVARIQEMRRDKERRDKADKFRLQQQLKRLRTNVSDAKWREVLRLVSETEKKENEEYRKQFQKAAERFDKDMIAIDKKEKAEREKSIRDAKALEVVKKTNDNLRKRAFEVYRQNLEKIQKEANTRLIKAAREADIENKSRADKLQEALEKRLAHKAVLKDVEKTLSHFKSGVESTSDINVIGNMAQVIAKTLRPILPELSDKEKEEVIKSVDLIVKNRGNQIEEEAKKAQIIADTLIAEEEAKAPPKPPKKAPKPTSKPISVPPPTPPRMVRASEDQRKSWIIEIMKKQKGLSPKSRDDLRELNDSELSELYKLTTDKFDKLPQDKQKLNKVRPDIFGIDSSRKQPAPRPESAAPRPVAPAPRPVAPAPRPVAPVAPVAPLEPEVVEESNAVEEPDVPQDIQDSIGAVTPIPRSGGPEPRKRGERGGVRRKKNVGEATAPIPPTIEEENAKRSNAVEEPTSGTGHTRDNLPAGKGISNHDIDRFLSKFGHEYLGCIACDEVPSKIYPKIIPRSRGFFVMNTDPSWKSGLHWVCVFMDARPHGSNSIEYFDSFADPMPPRLQSDIKGIAERLDAKTYLKLKENRIKFQCESSDNCGHFCMEFICDRMRGKPFPEASKFNDSVRGEDEVNRWKTQNGFGFLPSFGQIISTIRPQVPSVVKDAWSRVKEKAEEIRQGFFPAKKLPVPVQALFDKFKNNKVISAQIRREPIFAIIDKVINLISGGKFDEAKREQGYDKMFHLSLILTLDNGQKLLTEKNERINLTTTWKDTDKVEYFNVGPIMSNPTLEQFFGNTQKAIGDHRFFTYNAFDQNCQRFIADLLKSNNALSNNAQNFILQDAQSIVKKMPFFVSKIAQFATDTAGRVKQFFGLGSRKDVRKERFRNFMNKIKSYH